MKYEIRRTSQFKKDYKRMVKQHKDISQLEKVIEMLSDGETLPSEYDDHDLSGNLKGKRECYLESDWLLMYEYDKDFLILLLVRTGSHSELFRK